ncbi:MAG: B12-binding domain-containing radical SAM protein [Ruminococcus sp.]|nr:B12-binding domain-containing radical SAM protein [Ruminococcus sp.]
MKIKLVFPPAWEVKSPYPSLPCLAGYLSECGEDVEQIDLNLEVFDKILSKEYYSLCVQEAKEQEFASSWINICEYLRDNIDQCKATLRSEKALEPSVYRACTELVRNCIFILRQLWDKEKLSFSAYSFRGYVRSNSKDVLRFTEDVMQGRLRSRLKELLEPFVRDLVKDADVVGLSVSSDCQILPGFLIAAMCKAAKPSLKIVMGGSLVTRWYKTPQVLENLFKYVDFFSFHEGERSLVQLIRCLRGEAELADVPSLGYQANGKVVVTTSGESIPMDELPTPLYDEKNLRRYFSPAPVLTLYTCRGCYWNKCAFCDHAAIYQDCFRKRSLELIISDIETCVNKYGTKYIAFNDEAITAPMLRKLSAEIISRGIDIRWRNDARFDKAMDAETLKLAYKAGLRVLFFGLESYNERVLNLINKGIKLEWVEPVLHASKEAGIFNHVYLIEGFPTETKEEFADTLSFAQRNLEFIDNICITPFLCSRFSRVAQQPKDYNVQVWAEEDADLSPNCGISMEDGSEEYTFHHRFDPGHSVSASGAEFLDAYSNTAAVVFSDHLINCSNRKKQGEDTTFEFGTALYSADGKVHYASVADSKGNLKLVKIPGALEPVYRTLSKYEFMADATKELKNNGYPAEIVQVMLAQLKGILK